MNSSDKSNDDKRLQRHFQQVFNDYELEPSASLDKRIARKLPSSTGRYRWSVSLLLGMLLLVMAVYYRSYQPLLKAYSSRSPYSAQTENSGRTMRSQSTTNLKSINREPVDNKTPNLSKPVDQSLSSKTAKSYQRPALVTTHNGVGQRDRKPASFQSVDEHASLQTVTTQQLKSAKREAVKGVTSRFEISRRSDDLDRSESLVTSQHTDQGQSLADGPVASETQLAEVPLAAWQSLRPLGLSDNASVLAQLKRSVLATSSALSVEQPTKARTRIRWLASVAPLSTYQLMTVVAKPDAYIQRVHTPSALSGPTWGYQLSAGAEWRQATLQVTVGQIRRWAYYELATNTFDIESIGPKQYEVVQREQSVAENVSLTMLGLRISKQYTLGRDTSPYYVQLGGEASYVPHTHQSLVWAGAGLGANLPLGKAYQLQVGPTVSYGLSRLWSAQQQLIIHPYLVGVALTLRPAASHH